MEHTIIVILLVAAVFCLGAEAFSVKVGRVQIGWLGLALWAAAVALGTI